jgi:hypothetical protein
LTLSRKALQRLPTRFLYRIVFAAGNMNRSGPPPRTYIVLLPELRLATALSADVLSVLEERNARPTLPAYREHLLPRFGWDVSDAKHAH